MGAAERGREGAHHRGTLTLTLILTLIIIKKNGSVNPNNPNPNPNNPNPNPNPDQVSTIEALELTQIFDPTATGFADLAGATPVLTFKQRLEFTR